MSRGDFITTFTGLNFYVQDITDEDLSVIDIAHALSMTCRYGGHCTEFYSVAQHSVLLSHAVPPEHARAALFHDAAEAYLTDVPTPIKQYVTGYAELEHKILTAIARKFKFDYPLHDSVKDADRRILTDESRVLLKDSDWAVIKPLGIEIVPWLPKNAEVAFLHRWEELKNV